MVEIFYLMYLKIGVFPILSERNHNVKLPGKKIEKGLNIRKRYCKIKKKEKSYLFPTGVIISGQPLHSNDPQYQTNSSIPSNLSLSKSVLNHYSSPFKIWKEK